MNLTEIKDAVGTLSPRELAELVSFIRERGRLTEDLHASAPDIEAAWKTEIDRRVDEIRSDKVQGIPGEEVSKEVAKITGR